MGAAVGLVYAAARPGRVSDLTMIDAMPLTISSQAVPGAAHRYLDDLRTVPRSRRRVESVEDAAQRLLRNNPRLTEAAPRPLRR